MSKTPPNEPKCPIIVVRVVGELMTEINKSGELEAKAGVFNAKLQIEIISINYQFGLVLE